MTKKRVAASEPSPSTEDLKAQIRAELREHPDALGHVLAQLQPSELKRVRDRLQRLHVEAELRDQVLQKMLDHLRGPAADTDPILKKMLATGWSGVQTWTADQCRDWLDKNSVGK